MQTNLIFPKSTQSVIDESELIDKLSMEIERLPMPSQEFLPGIPWGFYSQLFTPAYWKLQYLMHNHTGNFSINYKLGENIQEEIVACLLGGFGLKAELGLAAFDRLKKRDQIRFGTSFSVILQSLSEPFIISKRAIHYRFPNQKARFISAFLNRIDTQSIPLGNDVSLRKWLLSIDGIGPKTASWITRNYLDSERVAIIDIHIFRACVVMGLFPVGLDIQKDYFKLEEIFLLFCDRLGVQPSKMDALMWLQMKESSRFSCNRIIQK